MEDRPGGEQVLGCSEGLLHRPQLLVAEHGLEWIEIGVGAQHEDAVELLLLLDLVGVDREVLVADRLQVAPKATRILLPSRTSSRVGAPREHGVCCPRAFPEKAESGIPMLARI